MSVKIIIDSTTDLIPEIKEKLIVVPLSVSFGETEYIDGVTINHNEFYKKLISSDVLPKTSQPTPDSFSKAYEEATKDGSEVVVITLSSKLSGTYQSACIAAVDYKGKVFVVDGQSVAIGTGILTKLALKLVEKGLTAEEIADKITKEREKICLAAMVDTLEYLKKGGRLSSAAAFAGTLLGIKPVIAFKDGEIVIMGKARGIRQANNILIKLIDESNIDFFKPAMLGYTGLDDKLLQEFKEESNRIWDKSSDLDSSVIGSVIGTHAGPGAVAIAFFKK